MAITRSQQAKQMLQDGGMLVKPREDGKRPGYYGPDEGHMSDPGTGFGKDTYEAGDIDRGGKPGGTKGQFDRARQAVIERNRAAAKAEAEKKQALITSQKLQKDKKLNFAEKFRVLSLKNLIDQKKGLKGISPGFFSTIANITNPQLDVYEKSSPDFDDLGMTGKNLTDIDRMVDAIDKANVTGDITQGEFEDAFFGPKGPPTVDNRGDGNIIPLYAQLGFPSQAAYLASLSVQAPSTTNQQTTTEDDGGLKLRFRAEGGPIGVREDLAEGSMPYEGGIMDLESARQMYGLGKLVKKVTRTVKKIAKSPIGKAALIGAAGFGIPGTGFGGLFGRAAFGGEATGLLGTKGIGAFFGKGSFNPLKRIVGIDKDVALSPFGELFSKIPGGGVTAGIVGASALAGLLTPKQEEEAQALSTGEGIDIEAARRMILQAGTSGDKRALAFRAEGGRIGYDEAGAVMSKEEMEKLAKSPLYKGFKKMYNVDPQMAKGNESYKDKFSAFEQLIKKGYQKGGDVEPVAKKTMPLLDMGGKEMDLREEGGFVPIGRMEKADDVPARLSKNEFVFTADAVRNAGDGDVDKGAEVMYNMMKNLEAGGDVSEESQGLEGARRMFQTSQRLEEVI